MLIYLKPSIQLKVCIWSVDITYTSKQLKLPKEPADWPPALQVVSGQLHATHHPAPDRSFLLQYREKIKMKSLKIVQDDCMGQITESHSLWHRSDFSFSLEKTGCKDLSKMQSLPHSLFLKEPQTANVVSD